MTLESLLGFRNQDSTENINAPFSALVPKGICRGGYVIPEPASLQVRIVGSEDDDVILMAFGPNGMMVREKAEQRVLPVTAGITNIILLRIKYVESAPPIAQYEVLSEGAYEADPDIAYLVRLASVTVPVGATAVLPEHINLSDRDSVEGFSRDIMRAVVETVEDLPAASGFPATAEINLIGNTFTSGTYVEIQTTSLVQFPFVPAINFSLAPPATPGVSRVNPSHRSVISAIQNNLTGEVTVLLSAPHGVITGSTIRLSDVSAPQANQIWIVATTPTGTTLTFNAPLVVAWSGTGGSMVDTSVAALVTATTAPGVLHSLVPSQQITISGVSDPTFNGLFTITSVINAQVFQYQQSGYPTRDSGNGLVSKVGFSLPANAVEIGESATETSLNFAGAVEASILAGDLKVLSIGSSLQLQATVIGSSGNAYTLSKLEPGTIPSTEQIVLSGPTFVGGVDPSPSSGAGADLRAGDCYIVLEGDSGTPELWTFDGSIFRNLTSAEVGTLLDFHRRNLLLNEKHLTENEKAALVGTVGTPSAANPYVTAEDTSVLTVSLAAALQGADGVPPSGSNRFLTEARIRGQRGDINVPALQNYVELPVGERWIIGEDNAATDSSLSLPYFNFVREDTLLDPGGPTEYAQANFSPVTITTLYVDAGLTVELDPSIHAEPNGIYPRSDAALLLLPTQLFVKLSSVPDNGVGTVLYSEAVIEKNRKPSSDMLATPQRIQSSGQADLLNRVQELRYNAGISVATTILTLPANLFAATNLQGYGLARTSGNGHPISLTSAFTINFATGTGTGGIVNPFTPVSFSGPTLNQWTRYILAVDPDGTTISVYPVSALLEKSTDLSFAGTLASVAKPTQAFQDGSLPFASIGVQSDGVSGTTILTLLGSSLELYPYEVARSAGSPIVCGDGLLSFGHFTGSDSLERALLWAPEGSTIHLESGVYAGPFTISTQDIKIEGSAGAELTGSTDFCLRVNAEGVQLRNLRFSSAPTAALDVQPGADRLKLGSLTFDETSIGIRIKSPSVVAFGPGDVDTGTDVITTLTPHGLLDGARFQVTTTGSLPGGLLGFTDYYVVASGATTLSLSMSLGGPAVDITSGGTGVHTLNAGGKILDLGTDEQQDDGVSITVTDGTGGRFIGTWNSPDGIQFAHDAAGVGQSVLIFPGVYSRVIVSGSRLSFRGINGAGGEARVDGDGGANVCFAVTGSFNTFENLYLENAAVGVDVQTGGSNNRITDSVTFASNIGTFVKFPQTVSGKHYNFHASLSGNLLTGSSIFIQQNPVVTIGDGAVSWGDYVGADALNNALASETAGTLFIVRKGTYNAISTGGAYNGMTVRGAGGNQTIIQANAGGGDGQVIQVVGSNNRFSGLFLVANGNDLATVNFKTYGILVTGDGNIFEEITFQETGNTRVESAYKYSVTSGIRNRFIPHVGMASGSFASYTVGDGRISFGDFNGSNGIIAAVQALATTPRGILGAFTLAAGNQVRFTDTEPSSPFQFTTRDLHRYFNITAAVNPANIGSFKIVAIVSGIAVTLERMDGNLFINEANLFWDFISGARIEIFPGTYEPFTIPVSRNEVELDAWEGAVVVGDVVDSPLVNVLGSGVVIRGLRFAGGVPVTGVGVNVVGRRFRAERLQFETALRYSIDPAAGDGEFYDGPEAKGREGITVSNSPSRADFQGSTQASLQAAIDAAAADPNLNTVILGGGQWTLSSTVTVPANVTIRGSGYGTRLFGTGLFPAFTLDAGGNQTVTGIRFSDFTNSLIGPAAGVFAYGNWLESAPIDAGVTGSTTNNL